MCMNMLNMATLPLVVRSSSVHKVPGDFNNILSVPSFFLLFTFPHIMDSLTCTKCNMAFRSVHFLVKHKEKFCIGAVSHSEVQLCSI